MRSITDEAVVASKTARRQRERRLRLIQGGRIDALPGVPSPVVEAVEDDEDDQNTVQPWERMLPVEEWS
jgi:putative transposase